MGWWAQALPCAGLPSRVQVISKPGQQRSTSSKEHPTVVNHFVDKTWFNVMQKSPFNTQHSFQPHAPAHPHRFCSPR